MKDIYETVNLQWHKNEKNQPKKDGEYLCKCVDVARLNGDEVVWSEPYFAICDLYDGLWQCDGVPVAWAIIPKCSYEIE